MNGNHTTLWYTNPTMIYYLLIGYALIGLTVTLIIALYDYRRDSLNILSALMGGLFWPLTGLIVFLFGQKNLETLYAQKARKLQEKQTQQHYRDQQRKR